MNNATTNFQIVGSDDFPEYPISVNDRLDAHYFLHEGEKLKLAKPEAAQ